MNFLKNQKYFFFTLLILLTQLTFISCSKEASQKKTNQNTESQNKPGTVNDQNKDSVSKPNTSNGSNIINNHDDEISTCSMEYDDEKFNNHKNWIELCQVNGKVQHVRIEDLDIYYELKLLFSPNELSSTINSTEKIEVNQNQLLTNFTYEKDEEGWLSSYKGLLKFKTSANEITAPNITDFYDTPTTICMDIKDSDAGTTQIIVWEHGENNANCFKPETLTNRTSAFSKTNLQKINAVKNYIYIGDDVKFKQIVLLNKPHSKNESTLTNKPGTVNDQNKDSVSKPNTSNEPNIINNHDDEISTCSMEYNDEKFNNHENWIELCQVNGKVQHVRIEDLILYPSTTIYSSKIYYELKLLFSPNELPSTIKPTEETGVNQNQLLTNFTYEEDSQIDSSNYYKGLLKFKTSANEITAPNITDFYDKRTTICMDIKDTNAGTTQIIVWEHGKNNADCFKPETLTNQTSAFSKTDLPKINAVKNYIYIGDYVKFKQIVLLNKSHSKNESTPTNKPGTVNNQNKDSVSKPNTSNESNIINNQNNEISKCSMEYDDEKFSSDKDWVELCQVNGKVQHVRIENLDIYYELKLLFSPNELLSTINSTEDDQEDEDSFDEDSFDEDSFDSSDASDEEEDDQEEIEVNQNQLLTNFTYEEDEEDGYKGLLKFKTSANEITATGITNNFYNTPTTICMDIKDTDAGTTQIIVWEHGKNNANCFEPETLTNQTSAFSKTDLPKINAVKNYIYLGRSVEFKQIVLLNKPHSKNE